MTLKSETKETFLPFSTGVGAEWKETFWFIFFFASPVVVNGVRNADINLSFIFLNVEGLYETLLFSQVTLHDTASERDLLTWYTRSNHANMHTAAINNNKKHDSIKFLLPNCYFFASASCDCKLWRGTFCNNPNLHLQRLLIKSGKFSLLGSISKAISIPIPIDISPYLHRLSTRILSRRSFNVLHVYWLKLKSENEFYIFAVRYNRSYPKSFS